MDYAKKFEAPIRCGVEVTKAERLEGRPGFRIETSDGVIEAQRIVAATGPFQVPIIPPVLPEINGVTQIHSNAYMNPEQMPDGAVLVVGAGSSGVQIADELMQAGRQVYLSVGPHDRPPRSYRGKDFVWWLGVLGKWDASKLEPGREHVTISVSGAHGGNTIDFRRLAGEGMTLVGMSESYSDGVLRFAGDLVENVNQGDANYLSVLTEADAYVERMGLDLPLEPEAHIIGADPECMVHPLRELDLAAANVTSVIWATGYAADYSWLQVDALDADGKPDHTRGISRETGVYFLGLPWQSRRGSSFIWGVWHDAKFIADQICIQRDYMDFHTSRM